jgi:hypothetical protein
MLRSRIEKNRAVPTDLLEQVVAFSERFKADYAPLNEFMSSLNSIASAEAGAWGCVTSKCGRPSLLLNPRWIVEEP